MDGFSPDTYDGTYLGSPEVSNEGTIYVNLEFLLLYYWLGYIDESELGTNVSNELGFSDGKVVDTTLGDLGVLSLGTYDGKVLIFLEGSTY